jgi:hypothetical protein
VTARWLTLFALALTACPAPLLVQDGDGGGGEATLGGGGSGGAGGQGGAPDCAALDGPCTVGALEGSACVALPKPDGTACDDGLSCTFGETCEAGACTGGVPAECLAPTPCHVVSCDDVTGQCEVSAGNDGGPCNDDDPCTPDDTCLDGACLGSGPEPDCSEWDGECTVGLCSAGEGCIGAPIQGFTPCSDDENPCTGDFCNDFGQCIQAPTLNLPCDDGNACSATATCNEAGECQQAVAFQDGTTCDQSFCAVDETCGGGYCNGITRTDCPAPDDSCWSPSCNPLSGSDGACMAWPWQAEGTPCDTQCTTDGGCSGGLCLNGAPANEGGTCDDKNACTTDDACGAGGCEGAPILTCDPGDGCCPAGCTAAADSDCGATIYLASANGGAGFYGLDLATETWSTLPEPPVPTFHRLASDGHFVFLFGTDSQIYRFDPDTSIWSFYREGPAPHLPGGLATDTFVWTPHGLVATFGTLSQLHLLIERGPTWGVLADSPGGPFGLSATLERSTRRLFVRGVFGVVRSTELETLTHGELWLGALPLNHRSGTFFEEAYYFALPGTGGGTTIAVQPTTGSIFDSGLSLDDPYPDTDVDPATGDIYFMPSQPSGTFVVLHTSTMTLEPAPPPPPFPVDWEPILVVARAPLRMTRSPAQNAYDALSCGTNSHTLPALRSPESTSE